MAEQTKKSKYNFGGHELDAKLYLQNIRDNAETFLNSKTDWTPEQKEEWKHAYTNFTNALQEDINNGGGRFSTDEFGTITDTKGEFSNTDSDNYYYNNKGQQISQEDYDALKKRKQGKYQAFEANRQFASYASQIGKGLREALAAKNKTSDNTNGFDYAKNGFDAYWQKKYNPAGTANDLQPYWNKDKEGEYTNRVAETMADLDDYMSKQEMNDEYNAAIKQEQEIANNKIWQQYLANEGKGYANVSKRNFGTEVFGNGWQNGNTDFEYTSGTSQEAMRRLQNAFKTGNRKGDFLRTAINMTVNGGKQKISNLGEALAYYKPLLDKTQGGWDQFEKVQDAAGNEIYKLKGSENAKGQPLYIWFKNGKAHAYRDDPYSVRKAQIIAKAQLGMKLQTRAEKEAAKEKENKKALSNPNTPEDKKRQIASQRKPGDIEFTATDIARENNLHGISLDVKNPYRNSLLKQPTESSTKQKIQRLANSPLRIGFDNAPIGQSYIPPTPKYGPKTQGQTQRDLFQKHGFYFKEGGSIQKLANGNNINGNPAKQNSVGYANDYNWNTDVFSKNLDHILGSLKQYKDGYANWLNTMQDLHYNDYTNASKQDYLNTNAYNNATVGQYQDKYKAGYEDEWNVSPEGNDPDGLGYNTLGIKSAQDSGKFGIVSGKANSGDWLGNGNMYKTDNSFGGITDARRLLGREGDFNDEQLKQYQQKFKEQGYDFYLDPNTKYYKLKPYTDPSKTTVADQDKPKQPNNFSLKDVINKIDVTDKWGIPRAMYADITNRKITDMLKKQPILYDPQEDHRYIQSDLDAEMNGQQAAAQLTRTASHPITSDGNLQSMLQLEATSKGNDAITAGRQQSNQRLREMQEQAWQQEVTNHTSRHDVAMKNRESLYNTANENKALEAAYLNQKFTVWDALAQEKEFKAKSDYEQMRARADQFAQGDINNAIKYGLSNYAAKYGLTPEDVSLWNKVYTDGTVKLSDIQKDPIKLRQWNKVLSATRQIQQDLLGEYYGIPKSKYWTIRQSTPSYSYSTEVTKAKKGTKLNLRKVREAAKGEKLAAAQLKAQTADADRFYKTTKDHIDRMYDAINRLTNYSSTKRKRKKKSN